MKPDPRTAADIWLRQAAHDLAAGERDFQAEDYSETCYHAEQVGQKALKAFLYFRGARLVQDHSVLTLAKSCGAKDPAFRACEEDGRILDQYYVPTRYPDALAFPAVPCESYTRGQARQALDVAGRILALSRKQITG